VTSLASNVRPDAAFLMRLADCLVVVIAIVLPWSTSTTAICIVAWILALLPTLDFASLRREVESAAGGLPVLLWCVGRRSDSSIGRESGDSEHPAQTSRCSGVAVR
jgi:hypothetical protein